MTLDAGTTAIVVDSTADFPEGPERFESWRVVPLYVRFGTDSFRDRVDLDPSEFYRRLRTAPELPTTSQPTPADFLRVYEDLAAHYEHILSLHIGGTFSGTVESARRAAEELGGERVRVFDTGSVSGGIALLALAVQRRLVRGTSDEEIDELVARFRREARLLFTVDTLEFLQRGGRIGRAQAFAGQLLNVKPILAIVDGEVVPVKRVRSNQKAFLEFARAFEEETADSPALRVAVAHADAPERLEALVRMVHATRPQARIEVQATLGPVLATHAGPGTAGLFWFDDPE